LLYSNKRIFNIGLGLLGARILQLMAAEMVARRHLAKRRGAAPQNLIQHGLNEAQLFIRGAFWGDLIQR
jgi:hypothetical protein